VARAELSGQSARWVYRSDAPAAAPIPAEAAPPAVAAVDSPDRPRVVSAPAIDVRNVTAAPPAEVLDVTAPPVHEDGSSTTVIEDSSKESSGPGVFALGVGMMTLPLTLTIMTMIAPVVWLAGSRPRH